MFLVLINFKISGMDPVASTSSISSSLTLVYLLLTIIGFTTYLAIATTSPSIETYVAKCSKVPVLGNIKFTFRVCVVKGESVITCDF